MRRMLAVVAVASGALLGMKLVWSPTTVSLLWSRDLFGSLVDTVLVWIVLGAVFVAALVYAAVLFIRGVGQPQTLAGSPEAAALGLSTQAPELGVYEELRREQARHDGVVRGWAQPPPRPAAPPPA